MNPISPTPSAAAAQERFGRAVAARLAAGSDDLPHDITERLRAGRVQALARRKVVQERVAPMLANAGGGTAVFGWGGSWFNRVAAVLPLVALLVGLVTIRAWQEESRVNELADVDAALLTDDLPPAAYTDPGFAQFLKREASATN